MYQAVGVQTNKVYAKGSRADCLRILQRNYPYIVEDESRRYGKRLVTTVLPEPIVLRR